MTGEFAIAVHALVYLEYKQQTVSSAVLARNVCTNPVRIRKVMAKLKKAGLVSTKEGTDGGYCLKADPRKITLRIVVDAIQMPIIKSVVRVSDVRLHCLVATGIESVLDSIYTELDSCCREKLSQTTIADIVQRIFQIV